MENEKRNWRDSNDRRDGKEREGNTSRPKRKRFTRSVSNSESSYGSYKNSGRRTYNKTSNSEFRSKRSDRNNSKDGFKPRRGRSNDSFYDTPPLKPSYRKDYTDPTKLIRLNKYLANAGVCSRREADEFISAGVISVNNKVVTELGTKVLPTDKVMFHKQLVTLEHKIYILLNKPKDTVTTVEDTHNRRTVMDIVKNACSERVYPVGRLDRNTTGVLLITNDGELTTKLTHPKHNMKKIYYVGIDRDLEDKDMEKMLDGVDLGDFKVKADDVRFVKEDTRKLVGLEIHSGQNRVVRRIFDALGYKVVKLDRVFFAGLTKKNVQRGKYRFLTEREVNMLKMGAYEK